MTDESGNVKRKYAYDPWGNRRNPADWTQKDNGSNLIINRGYTGHEHLDQFSIINMNGRVYDPLTAMFFSPDPFIQSPGDWKNYNRYSYCTNNPTRYTDPSGYIKCYLESPVFNDNSFSRAMNGYSSGGSSLKYWSDHQGKITYNWDTGKYEYASGAEAGYDKAMDKISPENKTTFTASSFGYDHLYFARLNGQIRFVGAIGGEVKGYANGYFVTSNANTIANVLAFNGEVTALGKWAKSDPNSLRGPDGCINLFTQNEIDATMNFMLSAAVTWLTAGTGTAAVLGRTTISAGTRAATASVVAGTRAASTGVKVYNSVAYSYSMVEVGYASFGVAATAGGIVEGGLKYYTKAPNDPTFPYFSSNPSFQSWSDASNTFLWPNVDKYIFNNK